MREVIIGSDGFIGSHLAKLLPDAVMTTRNPGYLDGRWPLDLTQTGALPDVDVAYICAGVNGAMKCEGNPGAFQTNVDGTLRVCRHYSEKGGFAVFISSRSVEWANTAYARQKSMVESVLMGMPGTAIVRAGRVLTSNIDDLCATLVRVGQNRIQGLTVWGSDDHVYER